MHQDKSNTYLGYIIAIVIGILVGNRTVPEFVAVPYLMLAVACAYLALQNQPVKMLCILPYLIFTEIFVRAYVLVIPYLFMPYLYILLFSVLMLRNGANVKLHSRSFILFFLYFLIEFINYTRADNSDIARGLLMFTFSLTVMLMWGSFNVITPGNLNQILKHIKYASIYLCGIVLARYLRGDIEFSGVSSSESTNGLAPVQISGYLGFSCTIFFFTIISGVESKKIMLNIVLLTVSAVIMLLSFSRGGLYFLAIMMVLYFIFNWSDVKSYFVFLLIIPLSLLIYNYVYEKTEGLLIERYQEEGSSGRDELVKAGIAIFLQEPLAGVGLGNFNEEVKKRGLYTQEAGAHNEFIRVGAEDGLLGIITFWGFFASLFFEIMGRSKIQKEYGLYFLVFFCLICVHNGLKIAIQPFILLLAIATPTLKSIRIKKHAPTAPKLSAGPA